MVKATPNGCKQIELLSIGSDAKRKKSTYVFCM
jgi:hypothetical protein